MYVFSSRDLNQFVSPLSGGVQTLKESIRRFLRRAFFEVSDSLGMAYEFVTSGFYWMIVCCGFFSMYTWIMFYVAFLLHVNPWVTIIPPLIPMTLGWYYIVRKQARNYLALLLAPQRTYDTEKAVREYLELLENQKHKRIIHKT